MCASGESVICVQPIIERSPLRGSGFEQAQLYGSRLQVADPGADQPNRPRLVQMLIEKPREGLGELVVTVAGVGKGCLTGMSLKRVVANFHGDRARGQAMPAEAVSDILQQG